MKMTEADFDALVDTAMRSPHVAHMGPIIKKELLHYDILFCLDRAGLLEDVVFRGGTSLRLCYGSRRYSEDLDFVGGRHFSSSSLRDMKDVLEDYLAGRYGLEVLVKEPAALRREPDNSELNVDKWQISVVTSPGQRDIPKQRVKLEVANIPAYTKEVLTLRKNHPFLPDGYEDTLIAVESLDEIMADKLVSLAASKHVRHRDIWDLSWLQQQGAIVRTELVKHKLDDYRVTGFSAMVDNIIERCPSIINGADFQNQMKRFLPADVHQQTLERDRYREALGASIKGLYTQLREHLLSETDENDDGGALAGMAPM